MDTHFLNLINYKTFTLNKPGHSFQVDDFQRLITDEHITPPEGGEIWIGVQRDAGGTFLYQYNNINATSMLGLIQPSSDTYRCASFK